MRRSSSRACTCGRHYDANEWAALSLFKRLTAGEISANVSRWPSHLVVEVRICEACERRVSCIAEAVPQAREIELEAVAA
jgi:hypothetical protein